jgi:NTE family protein
VSRQDAFVSELALVLAGGGARAAYQVGVLSRIAEELPDLRIPILTGVSAGALNAAFIANRSGNFLQAAEQLVELWSGLHIERVIRAQPLSLLWKLTRWGMTLTSGGVGASASPQGLVDTAPLRSLLDTVLSNDDGPLRHLPSNLACGALSALAITTTNYATGQAVTFIEGESRGGWRKPYRVSQDARLTLDHVMASAAIPLLFPAVRLGPSWHGDGGIRQTAPLSPAVYLGAHKILAVSTLRTPSADKPEPAYSPYPPPAQILGVLVNSIFLDNIDYDAANLERINALQPKSSPAGLRPVQLLVLRPSEDLGRIAGETERQLPWTFRYLTRGLGTRETTTADLLATLMFEAQYTRRLIQIGRRDSEERMAEIRRFLTQDGE